MTVAGAGLAGLSAAVALRSAGLEVAIADSAAQAGGRCRSYDDPQIGRTIDNGNHLVLSGNQAVARFRAAIGASVPLAGPDHADFAFLDLADRTRWTVRINDGPLPWWIAAPSRRVPGSRLTDYLPLIGLLRGGEGRLDARIATRGPVWEKLLEPVLLAALNTAPGEGSAQLTAAVLRETIAKGGKAMRPLIAHPTLSAAFIDPAVDWLARHDSPLALGRRLRAHRVRGRSGGEPRLGRRAGAGCSGRSCGACGAVLGGGQPGARPRRARRVPRHRQRAFRLRAARRDAADARPASTPRPNGSSPFTTGFR